jgi:phospholipase C
MDELFGDEALHRREFLQRTALAGGLAASLATLLPVDTLVAEAARRQRRAYLPAPRNLPIDTFVVLMMENRSFDHYLGWLPGADGHQAGLRFADDAGNVLETRRLAPDWQGCGHPDPDHSWEGGRTQLNGGRCDGFLRSGDNDEFAISYYAEDDLGFIGHAAQAFTTFDRFHCSLMASTLPNREYMWAAQSYGNVDNSLPPQTQYTTGFPDTTIFAALDRAGVSNRYFYNDVPISALWGAARLANSGSIAEYYARAAGGTVDKDFGLMGFRIPAIAVSPWVRRGYVSHSIYGFESILKLIEYRFGLQPLTRRDAYAGNIGRSFEWEASPRLDPPGPRPEHVVSMACPGALPGGLRAKDHDVLDLVSSGYLDRMGFEYRAATPESTFREPSKVLQAHAA